MICIPLAKSFPEPLGMTPNVIVLIFVSPQRISWIDPSPPIAMTVAYGSFVVIAWAISVPCPGYLVAKTLYSICLFLSVSTRRIQILRLPEDWELGFRIK